MGHRIVMGLKMALVVAAVVGPGCAHQMVPIAQVPSQVMVQAPDHLRVMVAHMRERPLGDTELAQFERAGIRWDYEVRITETGGVGVRLEQLQNTARSLSGVQSTETIGLPSRVEPNGTTVIDVRAVLATSNPEEPGNLRGVQELVFRGRDDRGRPVQLTVQVPLA